jgi:hypothetical protein
MRLSKYRFYPVFFGFLLSQAALVDSCAPLTLTEDRKSVAGAGQLQFSAINARNNDLYTVRAVRLAENDACIVYGDYKAGVRIADAERIAREYAGNIGPAITGAFGNYYHPQNKKLIILLLDIIDNYDPKSSPTYIAGYFSMKDIFPRSFIRDSNEAPMLYIDIKPGKPGDRNFYPTIAHELQHLINFSSRYQKKNPDLSAILAIKEQEKKQEALNTLIASIQQVVWVDEGLSSAAEYIYNNAKGNGHITDKVDFYNNAQKYHKQGQSNIPKGNNFFTWGENGETDKFVYDDYVTVYLFFQWLRIHASANNASAYSIYQSIIESEYTDYRAVTAAARKHIPGIFEGIAPDGDPAGEWERLLETWLAANYINAPEKGGTGGFWGYNSEIILTPVMLSDTTILLYPGEGVYSSLSGKTFDHPQNSPEPIRYAGLNKKEETLTRITPGNPGQGTALLTFNANHQGGAPEQGALTNIEPAPAGPPPADRAAGIPAQPLPVDIRPPLRF